MKPSRRLGYRLHVDFEADRDHLNLAFQNNGRLGVGVQARSQTVTGGSVQLHDRRRRCRL